MPAKSQTSGGAALELRQLGKRFGTRVALEGIDLELRPGEFVSVVGPSGSGKSTLLRILSGLEPPSAGSAHIDGSSVSQQHAVRMVFQEPRLLPWRSVRENACIGASPAQAARAAEVLARVGLGDRLDDYPAVLSGGQRQRVALARALVHQPRLLLLDEPFASLDALTRMAAQRLVESLWAQHGFSAVLVTHDVEEAVLLSDRVLVLDAGRFCYSVEIGLPRPRARHLPEVAQRSSLLLGQILGSSLAGEPWLERGVEQRQRARGAAR